MVFKQGISTKMAILFVFVLFCNLWFLADSVKAAGDTLTVAISTDLEATDPHQIKGSASRFFQIAVFESLYRRDESGKLIPALATGFTTSKDGRRVEFSLRKGVRFHNGDPFTAHDVKFSLERAKDPKIGVALVAALKNIQSVDVIDDYRVAFNLVKPDASFLSILEFRLNVLPANYVKKVGTEGLMKQPVGTGPFRFVSRAVKEYVKFERFDGYWGSKPSFKTLTFKVIPEPTTRVALLRRGEVDIITQVPFQSVEEIKKAPGLKIQTIRTNERTFIKMNTLRDKSPFKDRRVRQALNYAIDKQSIINGVLNGFAVETATGITKGIIGYDETIKPYPYDPKKAKALLAEAGYPNGFNGGDLFFPSGDRVPRLKDVMEAVAAYWAEVGIRVNLRAVEYSAWLGSVQTREAYGFGWMVRHETTWDPEERLLSHNRCGAFYSIFCESPEMDKMIDESKEIMDLGKRREHFRRFFKIFYEESPEVFLYETVQVYGMRNEIIWEPGDGNIFLDLVSAKIKGK